MYANEMHAPYDKHHNLLSQQNMHDYFKYEVQCNIRVSLTFSAGGL